MPTLLKVVLIGAVACALWMNNKSMYGSVRGANRRLVLSPARIVRICVCAHNAVRQHSCHRSASCPWSTTQRTYARH